MAVENAPGWDAIEETVTDFLQVVGISSAELEQMQQSTTAAVLDALAHHNPDLVTDPNR